MRGKFLKVVDSKTDYDSVVSKWYYELVVHTEQEIFVGLHQEDERIQVVLDRRPFIDMGFAVIRVDEDTGLQLHEYIPLSKDRQVELQSSLIPGRYIIIPRTTGGLMTFKPVKLLEQPPTPLLQGNGELSKAFSSVVGDIFNKFDTVMGKELSYSEF
jgi:hypothetical protein